MKKYIHDSASQRNQILISTIKVPPRATSINGSRANV
jgi:hypothetical protein